MIRKLIVFFILIAPVSAQRYDNFASTVATASGIGNLMQAIPNATITVCNFPGTGGTPCTNKATTYTDQTLSVACGPGTQVVLQGTSTCRATSDAVGNFGFWTTPGKYQYCISSLNLNTQCYNIVVTPDPTAMFNVNNIVYLDDLKYTTLASAIAATPVGGTMICHPGHIETIASGITISQPINIYLAGCTFTTGLNPAITIATASNVLIDGGKSALIKLNAFNAQAFGQTGTNNHIKIQGLRCLGDGNNAGTITVTNGSASITGTSTNFPLSLAGGLIEIPQPGNSAPYVGTVQTVNSATSLTLTANWANPTFNNISNWTMMNGEKFLSNSSGQTLLDEQIQDNDIENVTLGISINADLGGSTNGILIQGNTLINIFGMQSGEGYAIHHADGNTVVNGGTTSFVATNTRIIGNYTSNVQRHDIYQARGGGATIVGNTCEKHRSTVGSGAQLPCFETNRSTDVVLSANVCLDPQDGCFSLDNGNLSRDNNILMIGNQIRNSSGFYPVVVGTTNPAGDGIPAGITITGNRIWQDQNVTGTFGGAVLSVQSGKRIAITNNQIYLLNIANGTSNFQLRGSGETAGTSNFNDDIELKGNKVFASGGVGTSYGVEFVSAAAGSGMHVIVKSNEFNGTAQTWLFDAAQSATLQLAVLDEPVDSLDLTKVQIVNTLVGNVQALTADWTCGTGGTVASCASATIIGSGGGIPLTFTLPARVQSWTLVCDGVVGQATATTANNWNLLTASNGATNVTTYYDMYTAAASKAGGATTDQTSTTTTFNIGPTWTLGAIGTKMPFHIWGKIEGASASGTVLSLQLLAPTVGDLVTIYRGTSCTVF